MIENLKKFKQALRENREMADQFTEELKRIAEEKSVGSDAEGFVRAAHTLGFDFTLADVEKAKAEVQDLDPDELNQVAGGTDSWCVFDFACLPLCAMIRRTSPHTHAQRSIYVLLPITTIGMFLIKLFIR